MNTEMQIKLEKFMNADGYYDIDSVREEYPGDFRKAFASLWTNEEDGPVQDSDGMSDEWRAAVEHNAEMDNNTTADTMLSMIVVGNFGHKEQREIERRVNSMNATARRELVRLMLQRIDYVCSLYDLTLYESGLTHEDNRFADHCYNRFLTTLTLMHLGREYGDHQNQSAGVDLTAAYSYANE